MSQLLLTVDDCIGCCPSSSSSGSPSESQSSSSSSLSLSSSPSSTQSSQASQQSSSLGVSSSGQSSPESSQASSATSGQSQPSSPTSGQSSPGSGTSSQASGQSSTSGGSGQSSSSSGPCNFCLSLDGEQITLSGGPTNWSGTSIVYGPLTLVQAGDLLTLTVAGISYTWTGAFDCSLTITLCQSSSSSQQASSSSTAPSGSSGGSSESSSSSSSSSSGGCSVCAPTPPTITLDNGAQANWSGDFAGLGGTWTVPISGTDCVWLLTSGTLTFQIQAGLSGGSVLWTVFCKNNGFQVIYQGSGPDCCTAATLTAIGHSGTGAFPATINLTPNC